MLILSYSEICVSLEGPEQGSLCWCLADGNTEVPGLAQWGSSAWSTLPNFFSVFEIELKGPRPWGGAHHSECGVSPG